MSYLILKSGMLDQLEKESFSFGIKFIDWLQLIFGLNKVICLIFIIAYVQNFSEYDAHVRYKGLEINLGPTLKNNITF
jgi:hypothetical protein